MAHLLQIRTEDGIHADLTVAEAMMAGQLICIKHPRYDGKESPVLSCKTCCTTFVAAIKTRSNGIERVDPYKWLADKAKTARLDRPHSK